VGLVKEATLDLLAETYLEGDSVTAGVIDASEADLEDVSFTMDNMDAGEGETTLLRGVVANNGDGPMALVHVDFYERFDGEWNLFDEEIIPLLMPGQSRTLEVPFSPSSSTSDVKMVINPSLGEADFENNSMEITRSSDGSGGCSVAPFPALMLVLPLLGLLKR
jgi:subtilase family serine protease